MKAPARVERASAHLRQLIGSWTGTPAFTIGHAQDLLAVNDLAASLCSDFTQRDNILRVLFLDPAAKAFTERQDSLSASVAGRRVVLAALAVQDQVFVVEDSVTQAPHGRGAGSRSPEVPGPQ
jgi:hypothetical protein